MYPHARGFLRIICLIVSTVVIAGCAGAGISPSPRALSAAAPLLASSQSSAVAGQSSYPIVAPAPQYLWRMADAAPTTGSNPPTGGSGFAEYSGGSRLPFIHYVDGVAHHSSLISHGAYSYQVGGEQIQTPHDSPGSSTAPFSISMFYNNSGTADGGGGTFFCQGAACARHTGWLLQLTRSGGNLQLSIGTGTSATLINTTGVDPANTVDYLTVTYDGSGHWAVDENGVRVGTGTAVLSPDSTNKYIWLGTRSGNFNLSGDLQDIRLWHMALTTAQDLAIYNSAVTLNPQSEAPSMADSLVDSIGVNTGFGNGGGWVPNFSQHKANLIALGIRHIRDPWIGHTSQSNTDIQALGNAGIHANIETYYGETAAEIQSIPAAVSPALESFEAPNEYDCSGDGRWAANIAAFQKTLYSAANKTYPVLGPSMCNLGNEVTLGDLHTYLDYGNVHNYLAGYFPGTTGWGGTVTGCGSFSYASLDFAYACESNVSGPITFFPSIALHGFNRFTPQSGSKPIIVTETGYGTGQQAGTGNPGVYTNEVDNTTQGKYVPRHVLLQYAAGTARTYMYALADGNAGESWDYYGLTNQAGTTYKPSFYALQGLISTLSDPGSSFATTPLSYKFTAGPTTLAHVLFQKRSGQYIIAIWNETSSWNPANGTYGAPVTVTPQSMTVQLPFAPRGLTVSAFNGAGRLATVTPTVSGDSVTYNVDDNVSFMQFFHP